jgi:hypothetical protein
LTETHRSIVVYLRQDSKPSETRQEYPATIAARYPIVIPAALPPGHARFNRRPLPAAGLALLALVVAGRRR